MAKVLDISSEEYRLGQQIQKYRKLRHLTQNQLADLMDMDRANIANYENGTKGEMGFKTLRKFSIALEVSVNVLLGDVPDVDGLEEAVSRLNTANRIVARTVVDGLLLQQMK